jgi:hypothetical protein
VGRLADVHHFANFGLGDRGFHGFLQSNEARSVYHRWNGERNPDLAGYLVANPILSKPLEENRMGWPD